MATNNFRTQDNFPLFCTRYFDGYEYEDEETGEIEFYESDCYEFEQAEKLLEQFNAKLSYYRIRLESGYYAGVQIILEEQKQRKRRYSPNGLLHPVRMERLPGRRKILLWQKLRI